MDDGRRAELVVPVCLLGCVIARLYQEVMSVLSPGMAAHVELDHRMYRATCRSLATAWSLDSLNVFKIIMGLVQ